MVLGRPIPAGETLFIVKPGDKKRWELVSSAFWRGVRAKFDRRSRLYSITV